MRITATVVQARLDTWFKGDRRNEREVPVLVLLDSDPLEAMPNTTDYRLSEEEIAMLPTVPLEGGKPGEKIPDVKVLLHQSIELSARDWKVQKGGRMLWLGRLVNLAAALPRSGANGKAGTPTKQTSTGA